MTDAYQLESRANQRRKTVKMLRDLMGRVVERELDGQRIVVVVESTKRTFSQENYPITIRDDQDEVRVRAVLRLLKAWDKGERGAFLESLLADLGQAHGILNIHQATETLRHWERQNEDGTRSNRRFDPRSTR